MLINSYLPPFQLLHDEILPSVIHLISNKFGNYVVQKLMEHGTDEHRRSLAKVCHPGMLGLQFGWGVREIPKARARPKAGVMMSVIGERNSDPTQPKSSCRTKALKPPEPTSLGRSKATERALSATSIVKLTYKR